jgi:hypothetical protein
MSIADEWRSALWLSIWALIRSYSSRNIPTLTAAASNAVCCRAPASPVRCAVATMYLSVTTTSKSVRARHVSQRGYIAPQCYRAQQLASFLPHVCGPLLGLPKPCRSTPVGNAPLRSIHSRSEAAAHAGRSVATRALERRRIGLALPPESRHEDKGPESFSSSLPLIECSTAGLHMWAVGAGDPH